MRRASLYQKPFKFVEENPKRVGTIAKRLKGTIGGFTLDLATVSAL